MIEVDYLFTSILGYAKYSLENVEKESLNKLKQKIRLKFTGEQENSAIYSLMRLINFKDKWFLFLLKENFLLF